MTMNFWYLPKRRTFDLFLYAIQLGYSKQKVWKSMQKL